MSLSLVAEGRGEEEWVGGGGGADVVDCPGELACKSKAIEANATECKRPNVQRMSHLLWRRLSEESSHLFMHWMVSGEEQEDEESFRRKKLSKISFSRTTVWCCLSCLVGVAVGTETVFLWFVFCLKQHTHAHTHTPLQTFENKLMIVQCN